jgi:hypothetical protein
MVDRACNAANENRANFCAFCGARRCAAGAVKKHETYPNDEIHALSTGDVVGACKTLVTELKTEICRTRTTSFWGKK